VKSSSALEGWNYFKNWIRSARSNYKRMRGVPFVRDHFEDGILMGNMEIFFKNGELEGKIG